MVICANIITNIFYEKIIVYISIHDNRLLIDVKIVINILGTVLIAKKNDFNYSKI